MTGFGRSQLDTKDQKCVVEIRTVNSKYRDLNIRINRSLYGIEDKIRSMVSQYIIRGKTEIYISYEDMREGSTSVECNMPLAKEYAKALNNMIREIGSEEGVSALFISKFDDVLSVSSKLTDDEDTWNFIRPAIAEALDNLIKMRNTEGNALCGSISEHIEALKVMHEKVASLAPAVVFSYEEKIRARMKDLMKDFSDGVLDEQRLATEIALFADKTSIDEEIARLDSHIKQFSGTLNSKGSIGKKLDFIVQEMNREINTIGSKANDAQITSCVVEMKNIVEKIREQIQNME